MAESWWERRSYGGGTQSFPKSAEYFNKKQFAGFSIHELAVLEVLTFVAWKKSKWIVRAAAPFIAEGLGYRLSIPVIRKILLRLVRTRYLDVAKHDNKYGHSYLVCPCLLRIAHAEPMGHFREAMELWNRVKSDQNDRSLEIDAPKSDRKTHTGRSKRSLLENPLCLESDQNDHQDLDPILLLSNATCQKIPARQDHRRRNPEGSRLSAAEYEETRQKLLRELEILTNAEKANSETVGKGESCNLQACTPI